MLYSQILILSNGVEDASHVHTVWKMTYIYSAGPGIRQKLLLALPFKHPLSPPPLAFFTPPVPPLRPVGSFFVQLTATRSLLAQKGAAM